MKKIIIPSIIILVILILTALVFDWGRREVIAPEADLNASTTDIFQYNSSSTIEMPIVVNNIKDNQEIYSPTRIEGKARGNWFFEGSFPIELIDTDGNTLTSTVAQAQSDWMTTEFVNFTAYLEFNKSINTNHALIVLSKDNPSGNPDFDQSIFIPVILTR